MAIGENLTRLSVKLLETLTDVEVIDRRRAEHRGASPAGLTILPRGHCRPGNRNRGHSLCGLSGRASGIAPAGIAPADDPRRHKQGIPAPLPKRKP